MTAIARKTQQIFALNNGVATNVVAEFGSLKAGAAVYSQDPAVVQSLAAWTNGWASAVINNNAPAIQDLNALFYVLTYQLAYLFQKGIPEWDAGTTYYIGSVVTDGAGTIFVSVADSNTTALTDATKWLNFYSRKVTDVTDAGATAYVYTPLNNDWYINYTGNQNNGQATISLPAPSSLNKGREIIIKLRGSSAIHYLAFKAADDSTIDGHASGYWTIAQYESYRLLSNGTNWGTI